eukprot:59097_1
MQATHYNYFSKKQFSTSNSTTFNSHRTPQRFLSINSTTMIFFLSTICALIYVSNGQSCTARAGLPTFCNVQDYPIAGVGANTCFAGEQVGCSFRATCESGGLRVVIFNDPSCNDQRSNQVLTTSGCTDFNTCGGAYGATITIPELANCCPSKYVNKTAKYVNKTAPVYIDFEEYITKKDDKEITL